MDTTYVLSYFGKTVSKARSQYNLYVKEGVELGRGRMGDGHRKINNLTEK
jgi:hypothetical protein